MRTIFSGRRDGGVAGVLAALTLVSCGGPEPPEQLTPDGRLDWAEARIAEEDYGAAARAIEEFLLESPLHPMADSAQYLLGEARYRDGRYIEAREVFERLTVNRPTSRFADDAQFGICRSYWRLSPEIPRDQDATRSAVEACDQLLRFYPESELGDEARELLSEAHTKLADKAFDVGRWYFDRELYESANIYFESILDQYPDAPVMPRVLAYLYESYREVGFDAEAEDVRERLLTEYSESRAARDIRDGDSPGPG